MTADDDLERRLRSLLSRTRSGDAADSEEFLRRVHRGARIRRVRRTVGVGAAAVLVLAGGGAIAEAGGLLDGSSSPVASPGGGATARPGSDHRPADATARPTPKSTPAAPPSTPPPPSTAAKQSAPDTAPPPSRITVSPAGPIAAADVSPVSLTATGTAHQWVLAKTPGKLCGRPSCASLFATPDHGATWSDIGQLPAPPATADTATQTTVNQVRFAKRTDGSGIYDGWVFGNALWSSHDSGRSWSSANSPAGQVTQLEAWGGDVYAAVSNAAPGSSSATLYRSPVGRDDWTAVAVAPSGLTDVQSLAAAHGVVGLVDVRSGGRAALWISRDGTTWAKQPAACPPGTDPSSLSTASATTSFATTVGALWVTCRSATSTVVRFTDTSDFGTWHPVVKDAFGATVTLAAQTPTTAYVAGGGLPGIERISSTQPPTRVTSSPFGAPVFFGFTDESHGYLLDSAGRIVSTTDGGATWTPYAVSDTTP